MVHIDDNEHTLVICIVNDLLNSVQPFLLYLCVVHVLGPRYRYSDSIEACRLYGLYHILGGLWVLPACLGVKPRLACIVAFKGVAQVPAHLYLRYYLGSGAEALFAVSRLGSGLDSSNFYLCRSRIISAAHAVLDLDLVNSEGRLVAPPVSQQELVILFHAALCLIGHEPCELQIIAVSEY